MIVPKTFIFLLTFMLLIDYSQAKYKVNQIVLIDKNLYDKIPKSQLPGSCEELSCQVCCGGIPPSCSNETLTCNFQENPNFDSLAYLVVYLIGFFIGKGNFFLFNKHFKGFPLIIKIFNFIIMKRLTIERCNLDISLCECFCYLLCCPCFFISSMKKKKGKSKNKN